MDILIIIEWLALLVGAWYLWHRSASASPRHALAFLAVVFALSLHVAVNLWAESFLNGLAVAGDPEATLNRSAAGLFGVQVVRCLLLVWAVWGWLLVVRPRVTRSWRGVLILFCLVFIVIVPDSATGFAFLIAIALLRTRWTRDVHGWGRFGLVIAFGVLTVALVTAVDTSVTGGDVARLDVVFGRGSALTSIQGELPGPAAVFRQLTDPWERIMRALVVLVRVQVAIAFLQLLVVPVRLRGLSIRRRFAVTLAMYRFIPGTLALIFMALIAYLGVGLHRASVIQHTFDATLERCLQSAEDLLQFDTSRGTRLPAPAASIAGEPAFAVIRDLEWAPSSGDTTGNASPSRVARTRVWSNGTPPVLIERHDFAETTVDSSVGLSEAGGNLFLRAARIRRNGDRAVATEVFVAVDSLYLARLARRIQSDVLIEVSSRVFIGEGSVQIVGGEQGGWTDSSFTVAAPFPRTLTRDDIWERRLYLARSFLPVGNWLEGLGEQSRIGAVQLQIHTTPRGLFQSLTSNALILTSQLFAVIILAGIALLFFIVELSAVRTGRSIVKGIVTDVKTLTASAQKFGEGDLTHRVDLSGTDEMGQLAATFNGMAANIEQHQAVLREKERLEADLSLARDIQQRMLPQSAPVIPGLDVAGLSIPSREVGGDLFYFLPVSGGRLGLTIGDVSGKSVPAALLMSNVLAALKSEARIVENEDEILNHLNRLIVEQVEPGRFVTFFYGVVDPGKKLIRYACAGHNPPLIVRGNGEAEWLHEAGVPLGVMAESTYTPVEAALEPGDVLVLYSDGVTEARSAPPPGTATDDDEPRDDEFFDEHRLESAVRDAGGRSATEIIAHVMDRIRTFTAGEEQSDDLTIVVVRILP